MSALGRMCLRLAAVAALRNATLAGENVFDSRVEAPNLTEDIPVSGAIAVYTEQDDGDSLSAQNGGPPFRPEVELVLEITMMVRAVNENGTIEIGCPTTDAQLEISIDLIEAQAELALFRSYAENAVLFRKIARRPVHKQSLRFTDPKSSVRLAIRYVIYKIEIDDAEIPITTAGLTGFDRLPEPFAAIARKWADCPEKEAATAAASALKGTAPPALLSLVTTAPDPASSRPPGTITQTWTLRPPS